MDNLSQQPNNTEEKFISLADAAKLYGVSKDYLRLLIFKGKLRGKKFGRNWMTTKSRLEEYFSKPGGRNGKAPFGKMNVRVGVLSPNVNQESTAKKRFEPDLAYQPKKENLVSSIAVSMSSWQFLWAVARRSAYVLLLSFLAFAGGIFIMIFTQEYKTQRMISGDLFPHRLVYLRSLNKTTANLYGGFVQLFAQGNLSLPPEKSQPENIAEGIGVPVLVEDEGAEDGDIVSFISGKYHLSSESFDPGVFGVVSSGAIITIGAGGEQKAHRINKALLGHLPLRPLLLFRA